MAHEHLSQNYIQLALCQADLLEDAWNGTGQFQGTEPIRGFGAVAGVYEEACQIVVRADSEISDGGRAGRTQGQRR